VRVQGPEKEDLGVQTFSAAYAEADRLGLDVVLINSGAEPPLVRLIDFGKYKFELERATKQKQKASKG
jgi:translation initiation factor IF-3